MKASVGNFLSTAFRIQEKIAPWISWAPCGCFHDEVSATPPIARAAPFAAQLLGVRAHMPPECGRLVSTEKYLHSDEAV